MSLRDYTKARDKFELGDGQHFGGFDFPCCDCKHVKQSADMEPCRTCGHNVNAVDDTANAPRQPEPASGDRLHADVGTGVDHE